MSRRSKPKSDSFRYFNSSSGMIRLMAIMDVRFPPSLRNYEYLLFKCGIDICFEKLRLWWNRFGPLFAPDIRRQRMERMQGYRHWRGHLDEIFVRINGERHDLLRGLIARARSSKPLSRGSATKQRLGSF
jgi:putative transposase